MDPIPAWVRKLWDEWDVRMLVLVSLSLQIILFVLGSRRKYITATWVRIIVWLAYLTADWTATLALGKLSNASKDSNDNTIDNSNKSAASDAAAVWAPLLLLHLGGPDTITAYALEDNKLWLRHFLGMVIHVAVAIYVLLISWSSKNVSRLPYLALPLFVAGMIKYGERTWVLMSIGSEMSKHTVPFDHFSLNSEYLRNNPNDEADNIVSAHQLFTFYKPHIPSYLFSEYGMHSGSIGVEMRDGRKLKDILDVQMSFLYDVLYTKAIITYTKYGCALRFISFSCTLSAATGFVIIVFYDPRRRHDDGPSYYSTVEVYITGVLLVGAVFLELYAAFLVLSSDWAMVWLIKHIKNRFVPSLLRIRAHVFACKKKRWSNSAGQFNLLTSCCVQGKKKLVKLSSKILKSLGIMDDEVILRDYCHKKRVPIPREWDEQFVHNLYSLYNSEFLRSGGRKTLEQYGCLQYFGVEREFDESIIILHIATCICYYGIEPEGSSERQREMSKFLSEYMMYLFAHCPFLLPNKLKRSAYIDAHEELVTVFRQLGDPVSNEAEACELLLERKNCIGVERGRGRDGVVRAACNLGETLKRENQRWKILNLAWEEMLCYVANECPQINHAQQLRRGGELITIVWLHIIQSPLSLIATKASERLLDRTSFNTENWEATRVVQLPARAPRLAPSPSSELHY